MKRLSIFLIFAFFIVNMSAQNINQSNMPAVVLNAFKLKFPNSVNAKWKLESGNYCVEFEVNDKYNKFIMDYKGNALSHVQDLYLSEIPKQVLETIQSKVVFFDINDADKYETNGKTIYVIFFKIDGKDHYFWIEKNGKLLKFRKELKESEVPHSMIELIKKRYNTFGYNRAKYVEEIKLNIYIIRGKVNDYEHIFTYDHKENLLKHEYKLRNSEIPDAVIKTLKKGYPGYEIRNASYIDEGGNRSYGIELRKSKKRVLVYLTPEGEIMDKK